MTGSITAAKTAAMEKTDGQKTIRDYIRSMEGEIAKALPSVMTPERFTRITLSALSANRKLQECTPQSFLGAMMTAAQLGVEPNTPLGQAYLIPYFNGKSKKLEVQFQLGFKGMIDLAYRSGQISTITAHTVYENDTFEYEYGLETKLKHIPAKTNRGSAIYYYATFKTKDGGYGFEVMSREDVEAVRRASSKAADNGPWVTHFDEMAKKTVLKRVLKYAPLKTEFVRELSSDSTIKTTISADMYDEPDETIEADYADLEPDPETGEAVQKAGDAK